MEEVSLEKMYPRHEEVVELEPGVEEPSSHHKAKADRAACQLVEAGSQL